MQQADGDLADGWTAHKHPENGAIYYYNAASGQTSWTKPEKPQAAAPAALPAGWTEHLDAGSGKTFYYSASTGQTTWERPQAASAAPAASQPAVQTSQPSVLAAGWAEHVDQASGRTFYHNATTGETSWERPQAPAQGAPSDQPAGAQQAAVGSLGEPLDSISAFLSEAKVIRDQFKSCEDQIVGAVLVEYSETLKQNAAQTFAAVSAAADELLPKAREQAALSAHALDALNTAIQAHEMRYGCTKSEVIPVTLLMAKDKPGGRNYPTLVQQVETLCSRSLSELEERENSAFKAQLLRGGAHQALDAQLADLKTRLKPSMQNLYQKYGQVLAQSDHTPVYQKIGSGEKELSIMTWNVMEFPAPVREVGKELVLDGLQTFCDLVIKDLKREEDRQLLIDSLSSEDIIAQHAQQVLHTIQDAFEVRDVDVVLLQELSYDVQEQIKDLCKGKSWYTCFSSGNADSSKCDAITGIISNKDFQEEEAGGVEIQEGKVVRFFAAARRQNTWLVSCHVPLVSQEREQREGAKQEVGVKVVQKLVQELHGKGKSLVVGGDWGTDVKGVQNRLSVQMPYGCSESKAYTDTKTCFGASVPVDGILEVS